MPKSNCGQKSRFFKGGFSKARNLAICKSFIALRISFEFQCFKYFKISFQVDTRSNQKRTIFYPRK